MDKQRKRKAMTFLEMVICLAVLALCFVVMVRGFGNMGFLRAQIQDDANLYIETEQLIAELEGQPAGSYHGDLSDGWYYQTEVQDEIWVLHVIHEERHQQYDIILNEVGP